MRGYHHVSCLRPSSARSHRPFLTRSIRLDVDWRRRVSLEVRSTGPELQCRTPGPTMLPWGGASASINGWFMQGSTSVFFPLKVLSCSLHLEKRHNRTRGPRVRTLPISTPRLHAQRSSTGHYAPGHPCSRRHDRESPE